MEAYGLRETEFIDMEIGFRINLYRGNNVVSEPNELKSEPNELENELNDPQNEPNKLTNELNDPKKEPEKTEKILKLPEVDIKNRLIEILKANPEITQLAMAEKMEVSKATIKRVLSQLQEAGIVHREGSRRKSKWIIS